MSDQSQQQPTSLAQVSQEIQKSKDISQLFGESSEQRNQIVNKIIQQYKQMPTNNNIINSSSSPLNHNNNSLETNQSQDNNKKMDTFQNILQQINQNKVNNNIISTIKDHSKESATEPELQKSGDSLVPNHSIKQQQGTSLPPLPSKNILPPSKNQDQSQQQPLNTNVRQSISKWIADTDNNIPGIAPYEPYRSRNHFRQSSMVDLTSFSSQNSANNLSGKGFDTTTNNNNNSNNTNNINYSSINQGESINKNNNNNSINNNIQQIIDNRFDTIKQQQDLNKAANSQFKKEFINQMMISGNVSSTNNLDNPYNRSNRASFDCVLTSVQPYEPLYLRQSLKNSKLLNNQDYSKTTKNSIYAQKINLDTNNNNKKELTTSQIDKIMKSIHSNKPINNNQFQQSVQQNNIAVNEKSQQSQSNNNIEDSLINLTASITGQQQTQYLSNQNLTPKINTSPNSQINNHQDIQKNIDSFSDRLQGFQKNNKKEIIPDILLSQNQQNQQNSKKKEQSQLKKSVATDQYETLKKSLLEYHINTQNNQNNSNISPKVNPIDIYKYDITTKNIISAQNRILTEASEQINIQKQKERLITDPTSYEINSSNNNNNNINSDNITRLLNEFKLKDNQNNNNINPTTVRKNRYGIEKQRSNTIATNYPLPTQNDLLNYNAAAAACGVQDIKFSFNGQSTTSNQQNQQFNFVNKISLEHNEDKTHLLDAKQNENIKNDIMNKWFYNIPLTQDKPSLPQNNNNQDSSNSFSKIPPLNINNFKFEKDPSLKGLKNSQYKVGQVYSATPMAGDSRTSGNYTFSRQNQVKESTNNEVQNRSFRSSSIAQPVSIKDYVYDETVKMHASQNQQSSKDDNNKDGDDKNKNKDNNNMEGINMTNSQELFNNSEQKYEKLPSTKYLDELLGKGKPPTSKQLSNFSPQRKERNVEQENAIKDQFVKKSINNNNIQNEQEQMQKSLEKQQHSTKQASIFSHSNYNNNIQQDNLKETTPKSANSIIQHQIPTELTSSTEKINQFIKGLKEQQQKPQNQQLKKSIDNYYHQHYPSSNLEDKQTSQTTTNKQSSYLTKDKQQFDIKESFSSSGYHTTKNESQSKGNNNNNSFTSNIEINSNNNGQEQNSTSIIQTGASISSQNINNNTQMRYNQENNNLTSAHNIMNSNNLSIEKSFNHPHQQNSTTGIIQINNVDQFSKNLDPHTSEELNRFNDNNNNNNNNNNSNKEINSQTSSQEFIGTDSSLLENSYKLLDRNNKKTMTQPSQNLNTILKSNLEKQGILNSNNNNNKQTNNNNINNNLNNTPNYFSNPFSIEQNSSASANQFVSPKFECSDNHGTTPFSNNQQTINQFSLVSPFETQPANVSDEIQRNKELLAQNSKIIQSAYQAFGIPAQEQLLFTDNEFSDEKIAQILQSNEKRNKQQEQMIKQDKELYEKIKKTLYGLENDQKQKQENNHHDLHLRQIHSDNQISNDYPTNNYQQTTKSNFHQDKQNKEQNQDYIKQNNNIIQPPKMDLQEKKTTSCQALQSFSANASPMNQVDIATFTQNLAFNNNNNSQKINVSSSSSSSSAAAQAISGRTRIKHQSHFSSSSHHLVPDTFKNKITLSPEKIREKAGSITDQVTHFIQNNFSTSQILAQQQQQQQQNTSQLNQNKSNIDNSSYRGEGSFTSSSSSNTAKHYSYEFSNSHSPIITKKKLGEVIVPIIEETNIIGDTQSSQFQQQLHKQQEQKQPVIYAQKISYQKSYTPQNNLTTTTTQSLQDQTFKNVASLAQNHINNNNIVQMNSVNSPLSNIFKQVQQSSDGNNTTTTVTVQVMQVKQMPMPTKFMKRYFNPHPRNDSILFDNFFKKENFRIGKHLGTGKFSEVHMAQDIKSGLLVALKKIKKEVLIKYKSEDYLENEIKIQSFFNHPNILKLYGFYYDEEYVYLVQEYASHGELYHELKKQENQRFDEVKAASYMRQICDAFTYLHRQHVIHRDIKPENILMSFGVLKIADFGCSVYCPEDRRDTFCGTIDYISPEIVNGESYGQSVDIWSLGILTYELLTGKSPFQYETKKEILDNILNMNIQIPDYLSQDAIDFMKHLLVRDPNQRMSMDQVINHKWITSNIQTYSQEQWDGELAQTFKKLVI